MSTGFWPVNSFVVNCRFAPSLEAEDEREWARNAPEDEDLCVLVGGIVMTVNRKVFAAPGSVPNDHLALFFIPALYSHN